MEKTILSLSPSRISDFQQCPQLYKFRAIDKLPERPGIDAVRGSIVHLILEDLYKVEKSQRSFEWATSDIFKYVENLLKEEPNIYCAIDSNIDLYENGNLHINSCLCGHYNHVSCVLQGKGRFEEG